MGKHLKQQIGTFEAVTMVVGVLIGSGIFFKSSGVFADAGTPFLGILTWIFAGLITMASALTVAEISVAYPQTGGLFVYLRELFGEKWAFAYGWINTLVQVPAVLAALSLMIASAATAFIDLSAFQSKLFAFGMLLIVAFINLYSTKAGSKTQVFFTVAKMVPILAIIICGFLLGGNSPEFMKVASDSTVSITGFGAAILGALWAYEGWAGVGNMAGEMKDPSKTLPRSIIGGLGIVIITYTLINLAMVLVLPVEQIIASGNPATEVAVELFGKSGSYLISIGILVSMYGTLNGYFLTGARLPYAMAKEKLFVFPKFFGAINQKFDTPVNAILFQTVISSIYIFSGSWEMLTNLVVFVIWIFSTITVAGIFVLRRKSGQSKQTYRVPLYPIVPLFGIFGGIYILGSSFIDNIENALYGTAMTIISFPVYYWVKKRYANK